MRPPSVEQHSLHLEGSAAVLVRSTQPTPIKMKFALVFLLVCVALASAAPQLLTGWPYTTGLVAPYTATRTLVAGPTVVNGFGAGIAYPGIIRTI